MAGTAQAESEDRLTCERCHGFVTVEAIDGKARVRCNSCGHTREVTDTQPDKWTLIGPAGEVMTFGSWEELAAARRPSTITAISGASVAVAKTPPPANSPADETRRLSGSALLDVTPSPSQTKLTLTDQTDPNVGDLVAKVKQDAAAETKAPVKTSALLFADKNSIVKDPPESIEELEAASLVEDHSDDEESPLSLRDAIVDDDDLENDEEGSHETLSLADLVIVPAIPPQADEAPRPPPARGALRTLPPTPPKTGGTAAPPTITVEEAKKKADAEEEAAASEPPPKSRGPKSKSARKTGAKNGKASPRSALAAVTEGEPKRGWVLPAVAAVGAIVIWRIMASPSTPETPVQPPRAQTQTQPTPPPTTAPEPTENPTELDPTPADLPSVPDPTATPTTTAPPAPTPAPVATEKREKQPVHTTTPTASGDPAPPEKKASPSVEGLSMSELLDRAGGARRSGDYPTARDLYERVLHQNPGNVEANGGLGDVARAQGDLNSAKASYERALATSPSYGPAQLGLADTEWDLGNHAGAQRRYAQILERLGDRTPERVKQRGAATE